MCLCAAFLALVASACGDRAGSKQLPSPTAETLTTARQRGSAHAPEVVVTRAGRDEGGRCSPRAAASAIARFLDAVNRGDPGAANAFDFDAVGGWYSDGLSKTRGVSIRSTAELQRYLLSRHRQQERLRLRELRIDASGGLGQLEFKLARRAQDLVPGRWLAVEGKGALACDSGAPVTWTMGTSEPDEQVGPLCPRPRTPRTPTHIIACSRR
jgi:hypothetical protein